jgi:NAD+ kinase
LKRIGLVVKEDQKAQRKAEEFEKWLRSKNVKVVRRESILPNQASAGTGPADAPADLFCVIVLGGDGTFLSAVRWIGDQNIPILGVKFGEIGFLAETTEDDLLPAAEAILAHRFQTFPRARLLVKVMRNHQEIARETILNDVVINKGALARLANIKTYIDDQYLTTYRADGLIIATPTGSTAYSLAAGGPIVQPAVPCIVMTPICPFTLTNRPLIVPDTVCITIGLTQEASDLMLTFDGQAGLAINHDVTIVIQKGPMPVQMITLSDRDYFEVLKAKLRWSGGRA